MSLSVISPCTSRHAAQLPDQFTINFSRDELIVALRWCERFASTDGSENMAVVSLGAKQRKWTFVEENVMGYYINCEASPCIGVIPVTQALLAIATDATLNDSIFIDFDVRLGVYRLHVENAVVELPMPHEWDIDARFSAMKPDTVLAKPSEVVAFGRAFLTPSLPKAGMNEVEVLPFITCEIKNGVMTAHRSWEKWGGKKMSTSIPVNGVFSGSFSFAPEVVVREMYYVDTYCEGSVVFEIATKGNPIITIRGARCGFSFIACEEFIYEVRQSVITELGDDSCEYEVLPGNEWDATVRVISEGHAVDVTILPSDDGTAKYVRVSQCITESLQLTVELAEEINAWNRALSNSKLVRIDGNLFVVSDIPVANLSQLQKVIDDIVTQSRKVNDFIAIFQ